VSWITVAAIYFITWWVVLFAVLPWGVKSQHEHGSFTEGTDPGAPVISNLIAKIIWTTIVTTILFCFFYWLFAARIVTFDQLLNLFGMPH
jgi:predicted secreted protein